MARVSKNRHSPERNDVKSKGSIRLTWALLALLGLYNSSYVLSTEMHRGRVDTTRHRIRLFHSEAHRRFFVPLFSLERLAGPWDCEFSAQVRNHASLPPPE
jgi:hypothetical protein